MIRLDMRLIPIALVVLLSLCQLSLAGSEMTSLTGDTSHPQTSTFIPGEQVLLSFTARGLNASGNGVRLLVRIVDERDKLLAVESIPVKPDPSGNWSTTIPAPSARLGFFRVRAWLSTGVQLEKLGSRSAGYLTYCIVPDPKTRPLYPMKDTRFGMSGGFTTTFDIMPHLGIRWALAGRSWKNEEPDRAGQFAEMRAATKKDPPPAVPAAGAWKTYPVATPFMAPAWAVKPETLTYCSGALTQEGEKAWRDYCLQIGKALVEDYPDDVLHHYQITWEPVAPWGFKGTDEDLIRIYQIAYPALHEADPKAFVLGPTGAGIGKDGISWNEGILRKGICKYVDGYSIHPYNALPPEREGLIQHTRTLMRMVRRYSGREMPICGTEQGWATKEDPRLELKQAQGLLRENLIMIGEGFQFNFGFYIADYPTEPGYGYYYNLNPRIPHGSDKLSPKPIVPAYAAQTLLIDGHHSAGAIEWLGETSWGYAFERPGSIILALWDYGDKPRKVSIPVGAKKVAVYDWMGNRRDITTPAGVLGVTLTPEPVYVKGVSPELWGLKAKGILKVKDPTVSCQPGLDATVEVTVSAAMGRPIKGELILQCDTERRIIGDRRRVSLPAGGGKLFRLHMSAPAKVGLGTFPARLLLRSGSTTVAGAGLSISILAPIRIESVLPLIQAGGKSFLAVSVQETLGTPQHGSLEVTIADSPEYKCSAAFKLSPSEKQTLILPFPKQNPTPGRVYQVAVKVISDKNATSERIFPVNYMVAAKMDKAPVIDGDLGDWSSVPALSLRGKEWVIRSPEFYSGDDDLSATVRYAWDAKALYFACEVQDDKYVQENTGFMTWKGDCIQLAFDLDPGMKEIESGNLLADAGSRRRASEISLALTSLGPQAYRTISFNKELFPMGELSREELQLAVARREGKLVYEAAIPWTRLGTPAPPKPGERIGIALAVSDMDDPRQFDPSAVGLFAGIVPPKDPGKFGLLILAWVHSHFVDRRNKGVSCSIGE